MVKNLSNYFKPEQEIFLDTISYRRVENSEKTISGTISLLCQDNVKVSMNENGVRIIITRSLTFDPQAIFELIVSFGAILTFNEKQIDVDWRKLNLAEEFRENGDFVTSQLMSRITLLIGQITASFGQQPLMLPPALAKISNET